MFISWICKSKFEKRLKRREEGKKTKKLEQILRKFEIKQRISSLRDSTRVLQKQNVHARRHEAMPMCVEGFRVHGLFKHFQLLICKPYP